MATQSRRRRRIDGAVADMITAYSLATEWTPAQIHRRLDEDEQYRGKVPTLRTVERIVNEERARPDDSGEWHIGDSSGEDGRHILEAREWQILMLKTRCPPLTRKHAGWIASLMGVAPDYPLQLAWLTAIIYGTATEAEDGSTEELNDYLAFAPWRTEIKYGLYTTAVMAGLVKPVHLWSLLVEPFNPEIPPEQRGEAIGNQVSDFMQSFQPKQSQEGDHEGNSQEARE